MKVLFAIVLFSLVGVAYADNEIDAKLAAAQADESRPAEDRMRDKNRLPLETLKFFGLKDDMRVLELVPGGGWYTRLLAPVLAENGQLYVALRTETLQEKVIPLPGFEQVQVLDTSDNLHRPKGSRDYVIEDFEFGVADLDLVVTFRNLHNFNAAVREKINEQVFAALKSGGLYGVIDHTARHMEPANHENRRRVDPVMVIKEMLDIGFEFEGYSDLHYRADDELVYEVGRRSVSGNTDRFTLLFRKP